MAQPMQTQSPKILILATLAGGYAGADSTGQSNLDYPANTYVLPIMCPCMFPPEFFVRAFERGFQMKAFTEEEAMFPSFKKNFVDLTREETLCRM